jgi:hypothetical protein
VTHGKKDTAAASRNSGTIAVLAERLRCRGAEEADLTGAIDGRRHEIKISVAQLARNGHRHASPLATDVWGDDARGDAEALLEMKRMGLKISF